MKIAVGIDTTGKLSKTIENSVMFYIFSIIDGDLDLVERRLVKVYDVGFIRNNLIQNVFDCDIVIANKFTHETELIFRRYGIQAIAVDGSVDPFELLCSTKMQGNI